MFLYIHSLLVATFLVPDVFVDRIEQATQNIAPFTINDGQLSTSAIVVASSDCEFVLNEFLIRGARGNGIDNWDGLHFGFAIINDIENFRTEVFGLHVANGTTDPTATQLVVGLLPSSIEPTIHSQIDLLSFSGENVELKTGVGGVVYITAFSYANVLTQSFALELAEGPPDGDLFDAGFVPGGAISLLDAGLANSQFAVRFEGFILGDVNEDGSLNLLDVAPFVDVLSSGSFHDAADINRDGSVNLLDVEPFVALIGGN